MTQVETLALQLEQWRQSKQLNASMPRLKSLVSPLCAKELSSL